MTTTKQTFKSSCILLACALIGNALFAETGSLLDSVLATDYTNSTSHAIVDEQKLLSDTVKVAPPAPETTKKGRKSLLQNEPAKSPIARSRDSESKRATTSSRNTDKALKENAASKTEATREFTTEKTRHEQAASSASAFELEEMNSESAASSLFERSNIWAGAGKSEIDFDNASLGGDGLSAVLGFSFRLASRWDLDILGNYRRNELDDSYYDDENLNYYDVRGIVRFSFFNGSHLRLYVAGGGMYGQSDTPYEAYYWDFVPHYHYDWWGGYYTYDEKKHYYNTKDRVSIYGGLVGGGIELSFNRLLLHANALVLLGQKDKAVLCDGDSKIGEGSLFSVDAQFAITEWLRIGAFAQIEDMGDGEASTDITNYGGFLGINF